MSYLQYHLLAQQFYPWPVWNSSQQVKGTSSVKSKNSSVMKEQQKDNAL